MPELVLPDRIKRNKVKPQTRSCPAHRAWVRKHHCCVPGCKRMPIECAHVRVGTDGGTALKPSDRWVISLCAHHHAEQHQLGEQRFERRYALDLIELAKSFAQRSPHRRILSGSVSLAGGSAKPMIAAKNY